LACARYCRPLTLQIHPALIMFNVRGSRNLYEVLHINATADAAEIRKAFYSAALRTHPDKGGDSVAFRAVTAAFEILSCPAARRHYDELLQEPGLAPGNRSATTQLSRKRSSFQLDGDQMPSKRKRSASKASECKTSQTISRLDAALGLVRSVLQSMSHSERQVSILGMPSQARTALLTYMERLRQDVDAKCDADAAHQPHLLWHQVHELKSNTMEQDASTYQIRKVYHESGSARVRYQANIHVKALRIYTREQTIFESAIEHQIVLVQIKQALIARSRQDSQVWCKPSAVLQVCQSVLHANNTSEALLGLRAWVHIRAASWIGHQHRIGSMASSLASAVELHARLLTARATSWECFRAEWVQLLQARKQVSLREAEATADRIRHDFLRKHVTRAIAAVERILNQGGQKAAVSSAPRRRGNISKSAANSSCVQSM